jgi:DNA repair exonuclease SbcCD ATPase subunit
MKTAGERIRENKLNEARAKQREAVAELERLVKNLEDKREAELDRLIKKLRKAEEEVARLAEEQERLRKELQEAGKIGDAAKREEELKRLAREQQRLKKKTEEVVKQLSRLQSERARQALAQANEEMGESQQQLSRGERDNDKQEDVLDRLDEARRELERARKQAEEELGREQLARVADVLKRIKERQDALRAESVRIQTAVQQLGNWTRGLRASLGNLAENQKGLGGETAEVARRDLGAAPVFAKLVRRSAEAMEHAGRRFATMVKAPPAARSLPDAEAAKQQGLALRRLKQLLDALKDAQAEAPRPLTRPGGNPGREPGPGGNRGGDDSIPPTAQLKLLRAMQKELNERTEAFRKKHPDLEKLGPKEKAELRGLRQEQKEIADLLGELTRPAGERAEGEGEKK